MTTELQKFAAESILFDLDCTDNLAAGETVIGTPVMSYLPVGLSGADALTFGTATVNGVATSYPDGRTGKVGGVVQVRISGGTPETVTSARSYTVLATYTSSLGNTLVARGKLSVLPAQ
jgi:hypothetical protein